MSVFHGHGRGHTGEDGARRALGYLTVLAIVFVAYFVAGKLGQATTQIRSSNLGPVWPAYGVALAAVLLQGYRVWPAIAASAFLVALSSPVSMLTAAGQAAGATLAAVTGGYFLLRVAGFDTALSRLRDALSLIVLGALGSAAVSASIGTWVLNATGAGAYSGLGPAWLIYWLGDSTGVLLVTPLALTASTLLTITPRARLAELGALLSLLSLGCLTIFGDLPLLPVRLHVLAFALLPFVMWAAIRFGVSGVALSTLLVATIATVGTALGSGPFAQNTAFINAVLLDVFFGVLTVSGLTLAAVIAEQRRAERDREQLVREQAAVEARLRLAAIVESSDDAIVGTDVDGTITDWNTGAERLYGWAAHEAIGQPITSRLVIQDRDRDIAEVVRTGGAISHRETEEQRRHGTRIAVSLTMSPIRDLGGRIVGASIIARDITERKRVEEALREGEDKLRLILDSTAEAIYGIDPEGRCTFCNPACLRALGYATVDDLLGKDMHALIHHTRADGTPYPANECRIAKALRADDGAHVDDEVLWRADGTSFPAEYWCYPQRREQAVVGAVIAFFDITQRKHAEQQAAVLRDELVHLGRVAMLEALAGSLAHEINQPLTAVMANAEASLRLVAMQPPPLGELREALNDIRSDNQRASDVVQRMRSLLKKGATRYEPIELNASIGDIVKLIKGNAARRGIAVDVDLALGIEPVRGDRVQVQQVVLNLLMNACDAVQEQDASLRRVSIRTASNGTAAVVEVQDRGAGLSDSELAVIFEPFYTTKPDGMGLGLSICRAIVGAHGGTLDAARNPDRGLTFFATFPLWRSASPRRVPTGRRAAITGDVMAGPWPAAPGTHAVQFYEREQCLHDAVADVLRSGGAPRRPARHGCQAPDVRGGRHASRHRTSRPRRRCGRPHPVHGRRRRPRQRSWTATPSMRRAASRCSGSCWRRRSRAARRARSAPTARPSTCSARAATTRLPSASKRSGPAC